MGYDPIFKAQPGPAAIQPAPTSAPPTNSATSAPYPAPVPGYAPSIAGSYGPALSTGASSPGSSVEPYDYSSAIDPALQAAGPSQIPPPPPSYDPQVFRPELKRELDRASPFSSSAASDSQNQRGGATPAPDSLFSSVS